MKKHYVCTLLIALFTLTISSDKLDAQMGFTHNLGAGIYFGDDSYSYAVAYNPNLHYLILGDEASLSLGTYLGLGFSGSSSSFGSSFTFIYDVPLVTEFNFGLGTPNSDAGFGGFFGGGYGISKISSTFQGNNSALGPVINGGIRFNIQDRTSTVRFSYLLDGDDSIISLGVYYFLGGSTFGGSSSSSSSRSSRSSSSRGTSRRTRR